MGSEQSLSNKTDTTHSIPLPPNLIKQGQSKQPGTLSAPNSESTHIFGGTFDLFFSFLSNPLLLCHLYLLLQFID